MSFLVADTVLVAAATPVADVLLDLFVLLLAAKLGHELFERLRQPAVVGEILGGMLVGPSVFGIVPPSEVVEVFAELGVVFLLFWVGLETKISELRAAGRVAATVGVVGLVVPLLGGLALGTSLGFPAGTTVFLAAAMVATSVGITAALMLELGMAGTRVMNVVLGAAVVDDILAMIVLAVAVGISGGSVDVPGIALAVVLAVAFVAFFAGVGTRLFQSRPQLLQAPRFSESPLLPAVLLGLGLAALATNVGLASIIGAFLAGMMLAETKEHTPIEQEVEPFYAFFPPFFFAFIGMSLDLEALADARTLAVAAAVIAVAIGTKLVGSFVAALQLGRRDALVVGVGMVPRGEVGIVVAGVGLGTGAIDTALFSVVVLMSVLTSVIAPFALRALVSPP